MPVPARYRSSRRRTSRKGLFERIQAYWAYVSSLVMRLSIDVHRLLHPYWTTYTIYADDPKHRMRWTIYAIYTLRHMLRCFFQRAIGTFLYFTVLGSFVSTGPTCAVYVEALIGEQYPWAELRVAAVCIVVWFHYSFFYWAKTPFEAPSNDRKTRELILGLPCVIVAACWLLYCQYEGWMSLSRWEEEQKKFFRLTYGATWKARYTKKTGIHVDSAFDGTTPEQEALLGLTIIVVMVCFTLGFVSRLKPTKFIKIARDGKTFAPALIVAIVLVFLTHCLGSDDDDDDDGGNGGSVVPPHLSSKKARKKRRNDRRHGQLQSSGTQGRDL